ncbi:MAG TPA: hypothetical protein VF042_07900 [Gemmatimonadaceae bacterium]
MKKGAASLIVTLALASFAALSGGAESAAARPMAEVYYRCQSGYAFETNGSAVHCKKPAWTEQRSLANCPIGLYPTVDRIGSKDMCAATNAISGEIDVEQGCTPADIVLGFTKKIVAGKDYCAKGHPAEITAPSVAISI